MREALVERNMWIIQNMARIHTCALLFFMCMFWVFSQTYILSIASTNPYEQITKTGSSNNIYTALVVYTLSYRMYVWQLFSVCLGISSISVGKKIFTRLTSRKLFQKIVLFLCSWTFMHILLNKTIGGRSWLWCFSYYAFSYSLNTVLGVITPSLLDERISRGRWWNR